MFGPCHATGPPQRPITEEQLQVLNRTLDALHEEVAAVRAPSTLPFSLFLVTALLPLGAAIWLLTRAERSVIGADETIRTLLRAGLTESLVRHYLEQQARPKLPGPCHLLRKPTALPPNRPRSSHAQQRAEKRSSDSG